MIHKLKLIINFLIINIFDITFEIVIDMYLFSQI